MKSYKLLVPFFAVLTLMLVSFVSAANLASSVSTTFDGVSLSTGTEMVGELSSIRVPVEVEFVAAKDAGDVKVVLTISGLKKDIEVSTQRFDILAGKTYKKVLTVELPSSLKELHQDFTLYVKIIDSTDKTEESYSLTMQRNSYELSVLSADFNTQVSAGEVFPINVVLKNVGFNRLDDVYVMASVPELGIYTRAYVGDLLEKEVSTSEKEDSYSTVVYLKIPESAKLGTYETLIRVYNSDAETIVTKLLTVKESSATMVSPTIKDLDLVVGEKATYELIVVNNADEVRMFNLKSVSGRFLDVSVPSVVTVGANSYEVVPVSVTALKDANLGTYTFSVEVNNQPVNFVANVVKTKGVTQTPMVTLTVILAVIFVILLVVLVVLMTKKDKAVEEVETSYY
ncbi:MAG: hypothetical protein WC260_02020 [Candidatus Pacearchaeota archaeon]